MVTKVLIPKPGMAISEGTIAKWRKREGEEVVEGEVIVEIETAKAIEEVLAPASGVLSRILLREGETAEVYTEIAHIEEQHG
jgi:pyruvate/2-oxoglutarate dehydrogenase complex dihydrolipoamide acyltransferase (E2) component